MIAHYFDGKLIRLQCVFSGDTHNELLAKRKSSESEYGPLSIVGFQIDFLIVKIELWFFFLSLFSLFFYIEIWKSVRFKATEWNFIPFPWSVPSFFVQSARAQMLIHIQYKPLWIASLYSILKLIHFSHLHTIYSLFTSRSFSLSLCALAWLRRDHFRRKKKINEQGKTDDIQLWRKSDGNFPFAANRFDSILKRSLTSRQEI